METRWELANSSVCYVHPLDVRDTLHPNHCMGAACQSRSAHVVAVQSEGDEHRHRLALYISYEHTLNGTHCHGMLVIASQLSARVGVAFQSLAVLQCQQARCTSS
jgi:hypothetical protein